MQAHLHGNFDGAAGDFAVTHGGVAIAKIEQRAGNIHRQMKSISSGGLRRVHVAAEFRGHDGTARFPVRWRDADAAKEAMQRNFHFVAGIKRLKRGGPLRMVNGVKPDLLRKGFLLEHRSVMRGVDGAESR